MSKTLIFGGNGKVARQLSTILLSASSASPSVTSVIRNPDQVAAISALGATPVVQSIESSSVDELRALIEREAPDAVVWAAGAGAGGADRTNHVDRDGAIKVMDALAAASYSTGRAADAPRRFVLVSAVDVRDRDNKPVPEWYSADDTHRSSRVWDAIGPYMTAKLAADHELVTGNEARKLRYTIVRPGALTTDAGAGRVQVGRVGLQESISREDVAGVVAEVLANDGTVGLAFDVLGAGEGEDKKGLPIAEAVQLVADQRIDTFEGYH